MCGQCCKKIHFSKSAHNLIQDSKKMGGDAGFAAEHFHFIGKSSDVPGSFQIRNQSGNIEDYYIYKCDMLTEDNKCSIQETKPYICAGYPYYNDPVNLDPWPYTGCGYELDSVRRTLLHTLRAYVKLKDNK